MSKLKKNAEVKYNQSTLCLKPFVDAVAELLPKNLLSLNGYKVAPGKSEQCYGACKSYNGWHRITIRTHTWNETTGNYDALRLEDILNTLAHELAHLLFFDHSVNFARMQHRLMKEFITVLSALHVTDIQDRYTILEKKIREYEKVPK